MAIALSPYRVDRSTGALMLVPGGTSNMSYFPTPLSFSPDGKYAYDGAALNEPITINGSANLGFITAFRVDLATGLLTAIGGPN